MHEIFYINRDRHLHKLGFRYSGEYNSIINKEKYRIIDKLIYNVQRHNCTDSFIGLVLIFQAVFKLLQTRFMGTLSTFGYSSDELMNELLLHMYQLIRSDFKMKGRVGYKASFNRYISVKLRSKVLCIISHEKILRKYMQDIIPRHMEVVDRPIEMDEYMLLNDISEIRDNLIKKFNKKTDMHIVYREFLSGHKPIDISNKAGIPLNIVLSHIRACKKICRESFNDIYELVKG